MSETIEKKKSYPNAFRFGVAYGFFLQMMSRVGTREPLSARPFSYLTVGLFFGVASSYWDWWKRCATQEILYAEDEHNYHIMVKGMNNVRVGEEDETQNLVDYLTGTTTRL